MKKLYLLLLLLAFNCLQSQTNLVPNPSFEIHDTCPNNIGQFNYVTNWSILYESPDYYNSCSSPSTSPNSSVPNNFLGFQYAASGNGYAGFTTYISGENPPYREIMGTQLISPLIIGQKYYAKFKLNLALGYTSNSGANKTGLRFCNIQHTLSNPPLINNMSDIYSTSVITDTLNWTTVFDSFIADSTYSFIEVGNFFDDSSTTVQPLRYQGGTNWSYYYIDDVCISTDSLYTTNWTWTTGINEYKITTKESTLYPNPSPNGYFYSPINFNKEIVSVYDILGNLISQLTLTNSNKIDLSYLQNGVYFIVFNNQSKQKVIINK